MQATIFETKSDKTIETKKRWRSGEAKIPTPCFNQSPIPTIDLVKETSSPFEMIDHSEIESPVEPYFQKKKEF